MPPIKETARVLLTRCKAWLNRVLTDLALIRANTGSGCSKLAESCAGRAARRWSQAAWQGMQKAGSKLAPLWALVQRKLVPTGKLGKVDRALLRWGVMSALVLLPTGILLTADAFDAANEWQVEFLLGHPFYLDAQDVQVLLLERGGIFGLCTGLTLYLACVLLREGRWVRRTQICVLTLLALALPGMICVLWHGILYMAAPMLCVALLWGLAFIPFFHRDPS